MQTTEELFQDKLGTGKLHDAVFEATGKSLPDEQLREVFLSLPHRVRNMAHVWGLSDTVFVDEVITTVQGMYRHM